MWGVTARIESQQTRLRRIALKQQGTPETSLSEELRAALSDSTPETAYQWPGLCPGALYREGRLMRDPSPATDTGALWSATEAQVEAIVGVRRPKSG